MYHSITFIDESGETAVTKNTWDDWDLVPAALPMFAPPPVFEKYVEVPGRNGALDLSTILTNGEPIFGNSTGGFSFFVVPELKNRSGRRGTWNPFNRANAIYQFINKAPKLKAILEDDPTHYYEGKFSAQWASGADVPTVTISYSVYPWRRNYTPPEPEEDPEPEPEPDA